MGLAPEVSFIPVATSAGCELLAVNRACPIEADFTFRFDREPDFFAWPRTIFDSHEYLGFYDGERLIGYGLAGYRAGWTGCGWGRWAYIGDVRVSPDYRGLGWARRGVAALLDRVPLDVSLGFAVVKRGNAMAENLAHSGHLGSIEYHRAGLLDVVNLPILRRDSHAADVSTRPAAAADLVACASLLRRALEGRLFAPRIEGDGRARLNAEIEAGRTVVATRGSRIVGILGWHDFGDVRRATILRYSARSWPLRAAWRVARGAGLSIAPLPTPGDSLRAASVTHLAAADDAPTTVSALVDAAMSRLAGSGVHLLQIAEMRGHPVLAALRGRCRWHFCSEVWIGWRCGDRSPAIWAPRRPPFIDLAVV